MLSVKSPVSSRGASVGPWPCPQEIIVFRADGLTTILLFLKGEGTGGEEEKGVIVLRQYEDLEWLYHCLMAHNNIDGVVVS